MIKRKKRIIRKPKQTDIKKGLFTLQTLQQSMPLDLSKYPEKPVYNLNDFGMQEIGKVTDFAIGELYKPLQQPFRYGVLIEETNPILSGILKLGSIYLALKLAN